MLEVKNISKKYPGESLGAVNDISFTAEKGKIQSFVGRSGSGKTTMLRMLAGLMAPDSGTISYDGVSYDDPNEQLIKGHEKVKLVFQDYQLKPNMTVEENIKYQLLLFDNKFQEERTKELLDLCGLTALAHKKPNELSGGQQQRLSLATERISFTPSTPSSSSSTRIQTPCSTSSGAAPKYGILTEMIGTSMSGKDF